MISTDSRSKIEEHSSLHLKFVFYRVNYLMPVPVFSSYSKLSFPQTLVLNTLKHQHFFTLFKTLIMLSV